LGAFCKETPSEWRAELYKEWDRVVRSGKSVLRNRPQ
jgi:hypothetical protein